MASEVLKTKWKTFFGALDANHDGVLSHKDIECARERFSQLHHLDEKKRKASIEKFEDWWAKYIIKGRGNEISESEFVQGLVDEYKRDGKEIFEGNMLANMRTIWRVLNEGADEPEKFLSEDEFKMAYMAFGHTKIANDPATFKAFNPVNGRILLKDIIESDVQFLTFDGDGPKGHLIREQFETDGFL